MNASRVFEKSAFGLVAFTLLLGAGCPDKTSTSDCSSLELIKMPEEMTRVEGRRSVMQAGAKLYYWAYNSQIGGDLELWEYDTDSAAAPERLASFESMEYEFNGPISMPRFLSIENNTIYFSARTESTGTEIWRFHVDASTEPELLYDINPGSASSSPAWLITVNDNIYFSADNGLSGQELWIWNGNSGSAPVLVADMIPGSGGSYPNDPIVMDTLLYYSADSLEFGRELWQLSTVGEPLPALTMDINPGTEHGLLGFGFELVVGATVNHRGTAYFPATDGVHGHELWAIDTGASPVPFMVGDLQTGQYGTDPEGFISVDDKLYFVVNNRSDVAALMVIEPEFGHTPQFVADDVGANSLTWTGTRFIYHTGDSIFGEGSFYSYKLGDDRVELEVFNPKYGHTGVFAHKGSFFYGNTENGITKVSEKETCT